jgi:hypothetical protein
MDLFLGNLEIHENEIITAAQLQEELTVNFKDKSVYTYILYNATTNYLHWVNYNDEDILPLIVAESVTQQRYTFLIYNSTNLALLPFLQTLGRENFTRSESIKFGLLIGKRSFYVGGNTKNNLDRLPADLSKLIAKKLPYSEIKKYCNASVGVDRSVCQNKLFYIELGLNKLTRNREYLNSLIIPELDAALKQADIYDSMKSSHLYRTFHYSSTEHIALIKYFTHFDIALSRAIEKLGTQFDNDDINRTITSFISLSIDEFDHQLPNMINLYPILPIESKNIFIQILLYDEFAIDVKPYIKLYLQDPNVSFNTKRELIERMVGNMLNDELPLKKEAFYYYLEELGKIWQGEDDYLTFRNNLITQYNELMAMLNNAEEHDEE